MLSDRRELQLLLAMCGIQPAVVEQRSWKGPFRSWAQREITFILCMVVRTRVRHVLDGWDGWMDC